MDFAAELQDRIEHASKVEFWRHASNLMREQLVKNPGANMVGVHMQREAFELIADGLERAAKASETPLIAGR